MADQRHVENFNHLFPSYKNDQNMKTIYSPKYEQAKTSSKACNEVTSCRFHFGRPFDLGYKLCLGDGVLEASATARW